ncbi:MAG TPA: PilZ domain-containing protein [Dissulfurispiraceae bacterium]|nr:PilZ domain-containing protein [Dissulfurispiraceae bacterium]
MKTVTLYAAILMKIPCPSCGHDHEAVHKEPPLDDFIVMCPKCKEACKVKLNVRQQYRKSVSIPCSYTDVLEVESMLDPRVKNGWINDLSRTGCSIEFSALKYSERLEKKGNILVIFFSFPGQKEPFSIQGEVQAVMETGQLKMKMGISFINMMEHHQRRLNLFLMA